MCARVICHIWFEPVARFGFTAVIFGISFSMDRQYISMIETNHGGQWCFAFLKRGLRGCFCARWEGIKRVFPVLISGIETLAR